MMAMECHGDGCIMVMIVSTVSVTSRGVDGDVVVNVVMCQLAL